MIFENSYNENPKNEPHIKTDLQAFWISIFNHAFSRMVKKGFYSVRLKNTQNYDLRDLQVGNIIYANHCCWWDGIMGYLLCRKIFQTDMHMMIEELHRFPLLSKIGAFSVEKNSPQSSLGSLNYCIEFLENPKNSLWIFPQGVVMPPDYRPVKFAGGISYLCKKLKKINLIPVAHRYNFIREDRPEIFIEVGKPIIINNDLEKNRKEFTQFLEEEFTLLLDRQKQDISKGNFEGYEFFLKSRLCMLKLIEKNFKLFVQSLKF
ncbi:MAG: lysophospholipid acyltransferase family protein [bacterium]